MDQRLSKEITTDWCGTKSNGRTPKENVINATDNARKQSKESILPDQKLGAFNGHDYNRTFDHID